MNNIVRGGKVCIYMCKNLNVKNNVIYDSISNGIYLSFPSLNIDIDNNKIYMCKGSAIKCANQTEHGDFPVSDYNISISNNYIFDSEFYAIELNNAKDVNIKNNRAINTGKFGFYFLNSSHITAEKNSLSYFTTPIWIETSDHCYIDDNNFFSVYPNKCLNIVKITSGCHDNTIINNTIQGIVQYEIFAISLDCINITTKNNTYIPFYSYQEEKKVMK